MKATYGGVTVELGVRVFLLEAESACPVFHRHGGLSKWVGEGGPRQITGCGRTLDGLSDDSAPLPARHAVRFARPCAVCWPELRRHYGLFSKPRRARPEHRQEVLA